ncbi:MAG: hypothetical protein M1825_003151 [Sarcosagium campestre]|nr:MAG: hypothetical protein M1825_003151 [Sarcosagium campestre]
MSLLIVAFKSVGLLLPVAFAIIAVYAWARTNYFSLPIPIITYVFALLSPFLTVTGIRALLLDNGIITSTQLLPSLSISVVELFGLASVIEAALVTLAGSLLQPEAHSCALEGRWRALFQSKDATRIRRIQDGLNCCGLRSLVDKPWPFPTREHGVEACRETYDRVQSCFAGLQREERVLLGLVLGVGGLNLLVKVIFILVARYKPEWLAGFTVHPWFASQQQRRRSPRQIEATANPRVNGHAPYSDDVGEEEQRVGTAENPNDSQDHDASRRVWASHL